MIDLNEVIELIHTNVAMPKSIPEPLRFTQRFTVINIHSAKMFIPLRHSVIYLHVLSYILHYFQYAVIAEEVLQTYPSFQWGANNEFLWGVSTAAYQIEGATDEDGKGDNIWDVFSSIPGKIYHNDTAKIADDSYHKFEEDIELIKAMKMKSYRFSIAWSRIIPSKSREVNEKGLLFYNKLIDLLVEANIQPLVTLYHWDLPQYLHDEYGGWLSPLIEDDFLFYADVCFKAFGDRVKLWTTLNEPWSFSYIGYGVGSFAPGRCSDRNKCPEGDSSTEPYIVAHNVLNAHSAVVELYRNKYQRAQRGVIGIVLNLDWAEPFTSDPKDNIAAQTRREFALSWFADPIYFGTYPPSMIELVGDRLPTFTAKQRERLIGSVDFFALNHYTTKYFKHKENSGQGWAEDQNSEESKYDQYGNLIGPQGQSTWLNIVPWGVYKLLMWVTERYTIDSVKPVIIISENGFDVMNETTMSISEALHDKDRISYYSQYFQEIQHAVQ
jgi:beta-glucosidase